MPNPNDVQSPSMAVQQAAQNAATQAAQAAMGAQMTEGNQMPQTQGIGVPGDEGTAVMSPNAMPNNITAPDTPTAQNGQLYDDVSAPQNDPANLGTESPITNFRQTKDALAALFNRGMTDVPAAGTTPEPNTNPVLDMQQGTPQPLPDIEIAGAEAPAPAEGTPGIPDFLKNIIPAEKPETAPSNPSPAVSRSDLDDMKNSILEALTNTFAPKQTEETPTEPSAEESEPPLDINSDEFYQMFSEDPGKAISEVANRIAADKVKASEDRVNELTEKLRPLLEESERVTQRNNSIEAMKQFLQKGNGQYSDFRELIPQIAEIMQTEGLAADNPQSFDFAYSKAKNNVLSRQLAEAQEAVNRARQQSSMTLNDYFNDDNSIDQMVHNDNVKQRVINEYLQGLREGANPAQITSSSSNTFVANPAKKATSLKEAKGMLGALLNNQ